jgi:chitodextrinase
MGTRIEILRLGLWRQLVLETEETIKYNAVINRIGDISQREISHTNTFALPLVFQNVDALGLNVFNPSLLAQGLNSKFEARYYVEDKLLQSGFLIINNTEVDVINVNFIDEALSLVDKWGSITFYDLLTSTTLDIPADYATAIAEMTDYDMTKLGLLTPLSTVGTRGHNLASFPNNLNVVGDGFQLNTSDVRVDDVFNPYQSRPIFNVKALFDLACETYGYTPIYNNTVDWLTVAKQFMVDEKVNENQKDDGASLTFSQSYGGSSSLRQELIGSSWNLTNIMTYSTGAHSVTPTSLGSIWAHPSANFPSTGSLDYRDTSCIYVPKVNDSFVGLVRMQANISSVVTNYQIEAYMVHKNSVTGDPVVFTSIVPVTDSVDLPNRKIDITFDKEDLDPAPAGTNGLIGIIVGLTTASADSNYNWDMYTMQTTEDYIPGGLIAFDDNDQYISSTISLTHGAAKKTIKELLSAYMMKEGILMHIDAKGKNVHFFSYGSYEDRKTLGQFHDWGSYYIEAQVPKHDTNYGSNYAKINEIGLTKPYGGNTFKYLFSTTNAESKYKDFTQNLVKFFNDVDKVYSVDNTTTPYFEYRISGNGLVEKTGDLGALTQQRADGTSHGSFSGLDAFSNINYISLPYGVTEWMMLVEQAVRVQAQFLIPVAEIKSLDLSWPIYVEQLGGYYIIEEIPEYVNSRIPVTLKLIKLIDNLKQTTIPAILDNTPPTIGTLSSSIINTTSITLTWTAATDDVAVTGYRIYQDSVIIAEVGDVLEYTAVGLTLGVSYDFEIEARDAAGNWSAQSNTVTEITVDTETPTAALLGFGGSSTQTSLNMTWFGADDNVGVVSFDVYVDYVFNQNVLAQGTGPWGYTNLIIGGLTASTTYNVHVVAIDAAGNRGPRSNVAVGDTLDIPDAIAPTDSGVISLFANGANATTLILLGTPGTDNVGVVEYDLYMDSVYHSTIPIGTAWGKLVIGLTPGTSYAFYVIAKDLQGNSGPPSPTFNQSTDPAPTLTAMVIGVEGFASQTVACSVSPSQVTVYTDGSAVTPVDGDTIYTANDGSYIPYLNPNTPIETEYFKGINNGYVFRIALQGLISAPEACP